MGWVIDYTKNDQTYLIWIYLFPQEDLAGCVLGRLNFTQT